MSYFLLGDSYIAPCHIHTSHQLPFFPRLFFHRFLTLPTNILPSWLQTFSLLHIEGMCSGPGKWLLVSVSLIQLWVPWPLPHMCSIVFATSEVWVRGWSQTISSAARIYFRRLESFLLHSNVYSILTVLKLGCAWHLLNGWFKQTVRPHPQSFWLRKSGEEPGESAF